MNEWTDRVPENERIKRMQADIDALKCERACLIDALRPFVFLEDVSDIFAVDDPSYSSDQPAVAYFTIGDLRRARETMHRYMR